MKKLAWLVLLTGCSNPFAPPKTCWWKYTRSQMVVDTVRNELQTSGFPYLLIGHMAWTDSVKVCSR